MHKFNNNFIAVLVAAALSASSSYGQTPVTPGAVQPQLPASDLPRKAQDVLEVPPVVDRPFDLDEGPKVTVKGFRLVGLKPTSALVTFNDDVIALLNGYVEQHPQGLTLAQLQDAADQATLYYRQQGFLLAQSFIPAQDIEAGIVVVRVLEGVLGSVSTVENKRYSSRLLESAFADELQKTVSQPAIERTLLLLNDYPGFEAVGVFKPGTNVGETELVINVQEEDPFEFYIEQDNYGVETTGEYRLQAGVILNNATGLGDRLQLRALHSFDPNDSVYGGFNYEVPVLGPRHSLGADFSVNDYDIGENFNALGIEGTTTIGGIYTKSKWVRSRGFNLSSKLGLHTKRAVVDLEQFNTRLGTDDLTVVSFELAFDSVDTRYRGINQGSISFSKGISNFLGSVDNDGDGSTIRIGGSGDRAGGTFEKVNLNLARLQSISRNHSVLARFQYQYSNDLLSSLEQLSLGGPHSVRAYSVSELIRDEGLFARVEWIARAPGFADTAAFADKTWGELLSMSLFVDYGYGSLNDPSVSDDETVEISGIGSELKLQLPGSFFVSAIVATPLTDRDAADGDETRFWFRVGIDF